MLRQEHAQQRFQDRAAARVHPTDHPAHLLCAGGTGAERGSGLEVLERDPPRAQGAVGDHDRLRQRPSARNVENRAQGAGDPQR